MPSVASMTLSPAACSSSHPSSYDIPEQPPPTTRIRRPHSGLPSTRRSSATFFAAVSVNVIIRASPSGNSPFELIVSQDTPCRQQRDLLEGGAGGQRHHQQDRARDGVWRQHACAIRAAGNGVPERRVDRAG